MSPVQSLAGAICIKRDTDAGAAGAGAAAAAAAAADDDDVSSSINQQSYSVNQFQVLLEHAMVRKKTTYLELVSFSGT